MLSPADAALVARETALPGLAAILESEALVRCSGRGDLRASYLRYKPGTSCVAGLIPTDGSLGAIAAMTYTPARYAEVRARREWRAGPEPVRFLDEICTALVPLRHERKLKAARRLVPREERERLLASLGLGAAVLTLLRYKPGRRLVLRADMPDGRTATVKSHTGRGFAAAAAGARHADRVAGVPILATKKTRATLVSGWIEGDVLDPAAAAPAALRTTGAELARLHLAAPRAGPCPPQSSLAPAVDAVTALLPELAPDIAALASALAERLRGLEPAPCVIHGDLSADQVVLGNGRATIIDWDRSAVGDPARDLGSFLARLDADVVEGTIDPSRADSAAAAILDGYSSVSGGVPAGVAAQRAAALLALAAEGFRRRRPEWAGEAEGILARAESLLPRERPRRTDPTPGLATALDTARMGPRLAAALGAPEDAPLRASLLRHKPGRRALVRYEIGTAAAVLGKLRAKGPDRRTPMLHRALRAAGLDGGAPHRVGVPEPLAEFEEPPLWLQRLVPGRSLTDLLVAGEAQGAAHRTGHALARVHEARVETDRSWSMEDELYVIDGALRQAAVSRPDLRDAIETVGRSAHAVLGALPTANVAGIHRDFYPDQVLIDDDAAWIVDLDLYASGDALIDVGNFLAHLSELGLRQHADPAHFSAEMAAFLGGYEEARGSVDPHRLRALHWGSLIRHIGLSGRIAGRAHTTETLVAICAAGPLTAAFTAPLRSNRPAA